MQAPTTWSTVGISLLCGGLGFLFVAHRLFLTEAIYAPDAFLTQVTVTKIMRCVVPQTTFS